MKPQVRRCAVYTRKSSEEGLDQDFNSLDAQRESCLAYIASQKSEGWIAAKEQYDDGGFSGGNMERPALKQLMADIKAGKIHIIVVYKIDRLTRSLMDFAKLVEVFDQHEVTFVSVTQSFNTTTSMGRLTLNVLLSFAQFEREVTGERIRDKIAASKKKGMWMGGIVPMGYDAVDRKLVIDDAEAKTVRHIFCRYLELGGVRQLKNDLEKSAITSKSGASISRGCLYNLLSNPLYVGQVRHGNLRHAGLHEAIIDQALWDEVQQMLAGNITGAVKKPRSTEVSPLIGKIFDETGDSLTPSHANKKGRRYRYYISQRLVTGTKEDAGNAWRLPAQQIESIVARAAQQMLEDKSAMTKVLREADIGVHDIPNILKAAIIESKKLDLPTYREGALSCLVQRVDLGPDTMRLTLSLKSLVLEKNDEQAEGLTIVQDMPLQIQRRGVEMKLVIKGDDNAKVDPTLIKAVARARKWFEDLRSGAVRTIRDLAEEHGVGETYVSRLLPLAFLAPDIVEAIIAGRQPPSLTLDTLMKRIDLPADWSEQKRLLGLV